MSQIWTWESVLQNLDQRVHMPKTAPTLQKTKDALARFKLHYPDNLQRVIVVAGTNGKGTTSKTLETLLRASGQKTALYTSPHMIDVNERIAFDGQSISRDDFVNAFAVVDEACTDLELTHFEILTVMAAWLCFSDDSPFPNIDYFIFEVGMGGTWDATNAIPHQTNVITRLGLDHVPVLGTTLAEIASNKFGIIQEDGLVISLPLDSSLAALREEVIDDTNCEWVTTPPFEVEVQMPNRTPFPQFTLYSKWGSCPLALPGTRAAENTNLALTVLSELGFEPARVVASIASVTWPGRMERLTPLEKTCPLFFSGDHNEQGIQSLIELLQYYRYARLHLIVAIGAAKQLDAMMKPLIALPRSNIYFTSATFMGRTREEYKDWVTTERRFFANPLKAVEFANSQAEPSDLIIITGSLYTYHDLFPASPRR